MFSYLLSILKKDRVTPQELQQITCLTSVTLTCGPDLTDSYCDSIEKLVSLASLKEMELWDFRVSAETLDLNRRLIQLLGSIPTLISLKIHINYQLEDQEHLFDPLAELKSLNQLELIVQESTPVKECAEPSSHFKYLPDFINGLTNLRRLDIKIKGSMSMSKKAFVTLLKLEEFFLELSEPPVSNTIHLLMRNLFQLPVIKTISIRSAYEGHKKETEIIKPEQYTIIRRLVSIQKIILHNLNLRHLPAALQECENLEVLDISDNDISIFPGYLSKLKKLTLNGNRTIDLDQILTYLNPGTLQELTICNCNLTELPAQIGRFRQLKYLYLSDNPLQKFPIEIARLENIVYIYKAINNSAIKFGQPVSDFIAYMRDRSFSEEDKKRAYALLLLNASNMDDASALDIIPFLTEKRPALVKNTLFQLEKKVVDSISATENPSSLCICLFGIVEGMSTRELKEKCKKQSIQLESTLTDKTTHILIGKGISEEQVQQVQQSSLPLVTGTQLKSYLEKLDTPFLKESDTHTQTNLTRLLISVEPANIQLALEMINQGGLPDSVLYTLVLVVLQKELDSKIKKKAMTVLEKCAPVEITALVKRIRMKTDYLKIIQLLWKSPEIDKTLLARSILQFYFWESYSICSKEHQQIIQSEKISKYCLYYLLTTSVEDADFAVRSQITRHGILFWSWLPLDKLTSSKATLDKIEALKIHISDFAKKKNPLKSFTGLKTLYLAEKNDELREQAEPNLERLQQDLPQLQVFFN
ncbi:leucine-rich repeat domain-containing protein [Xanthocytophaga flava]|uniref:leucine-rich repeat domain-containing protein n=1 Tax=Xanthocytophaga flava TaxID=3048013 RepID=UPI0028D5F63E|nr:hypothetical protein [Xanthocytophaga flavus]MDJ1471058.1 hypothetical protein [Xanthocytophaga flavus]